MKLITSFILLNLVTAFVTKAIAQNRMNSSYNERIKIASLFVLLDSIYEEQLFEAKNFHNKKIHEPFQDIQSFTTDFFTYQDPRNTYINYIDTNLEIKTASKNDTRQLFSNLFRALHNAFDTIPKIVKKGIDPPNIDGMFRGNKIYHQNQYIRINRDSTISVYLVSLIKDSLINNCNYSITYDKFGIELIQYNKTNCIKSISSNRNDSTMILTKTSVVKERVTIYDFYHFLTLPKKFNKLIVSSSRRRYLLKKGNNHDIEVLKGKRNKWL